MRERMQGRGELGKRFTVFYALLATLFSLRIRLVTRQEAQPFVPINVTASTALFICLFKGKMFDAVIRCVSPHTFCPMRSLCYLALISAIQKHFSLCFSHSFLSFWLGSQLL